MSSSTSPITISLGAHNTNVKMPAWPSTGFTPRSESVHAKDKEMSECRKQQYQNSNQLYLNMYMGVAPVPQSKNGLPMYAVVVSKVREPWFPNPTRMQKFASVQMIGLSCRDSDETWM